MAPPTNAWPLAAVATLAIARRSGAERCWIRSNLRSRHFLCCGRVTGAEDGWLRPGCWAAGFAIGSAAACCNVSRLQSLDARAAMARSGKGASPCAGAEAAVWAFVELAAQRVLWHGVLFGETQTEDALLVDEDATYEACPPALLLALQARWARALVARAPEEEVLMDAYMLWKGLRWSLPLAWENFQDPLAMEALQVSDLSARVLMNMITRPEEVCLLFETRLDDLFKIAAGLSLTVAVNGSTNIGSYGIVSRTAAVMSTHGATGAGYGAAFEGIEACVSARMVVHLLQARRILDIKAAMGKFHVQEYYKLEELYRKSGTHAASNPVIFNGLHELSLYQRMLGGFIQHVAWIDRAKGHPLPELEGAALGPLSLWERGLAPVFSESNKDPVLERLFAYIGVTDRFFVEIGTQMGEQCNSRYFRVRYGFRGLMIDDKYENEEVNQRRHFVTPGNVVSLFRDYKVDQGFDFLSLDTDGNEWLLWLRLLQASVRPRVVVLEYNAKLPFDEDVLVRYTTLPVHRLCLARRRELARVSGGSLASLLALGRAFRYTLVYIVAGGTSDVVFVRDDVLSRQSLRFPAQNDLQGLCSLASYQWAGANVCSKGWPLGSRPPAALLTTVPQVLAGDLVIGDEWSTAELEMAFC